MSMWTAIALITIACVWGEIYRKKLGGEGNKVTNEKLNELSARIDRLDTDLRERVETLERIVTDRSEDLKRQFDFLDKAS